jgi:diguanylate cyclase (GGDEF)-like protein
MNKLYILKASRFSHLAYFILTAVSIWTSLHPFTLFFGISASIANMILLVITGFFGFRKSLFAAFITYSASLIFGEIEPVHVLMYVAEIAFVGFFYRKKFHNMIALDVLYWVFIGCPMFIAQQYMRLGSMNTYDMFHLQLEVLIGFFGAFLADLIVAYSPIRQKTFHFNRLMLHLALLVMLLPFLIHMIYTIHSEEQRIISQQHNQFALESLQAEKILTSLSEADMRTLRLNSKLQSKLVEKELQTLLASSSTDIAIIDRSKKLLVSTFPIPTKEYDWKAGGAVLQPQENFTLWFPYVQSPEEDLYRWNQAYIVSEKELAIHPDETIHLVLLAPFSPYLLNLIKQYQTQFYVIYSISLSVIILSLLYNLIFFRPLMRLAKTTTRIPSKIAEGLQIDWAKSRMYEISELTSNFKTVAHQLETMFTQANIINSKLQEQKKRLEESEQQLQKLAYSDSLTGLPNRLSFKHHTESIIEAYAQPSSTSHRLALLFIDLDRFKRVNDTFGHDAGDHLLKEISARLLQSCHEQCRAFRISGDEFVMLIEVSEAEEAEALAEQLLHSLEQPIRFNHDILHASCSIGIALYPNHGATMNDLLKHADIAMYKAKENGRNRYTIFNPLEQAR